MKNNGILVRVLICIALVLGNISYVYGQGTELGPTGPSHPGGGCQACGGSNSKQLGCCQVTPNFCVGQVDATACEMQSGAFSPGSQCVHAIGGPPDFIPFDACTVTTRITLVSFTAAPAQGRVVLSWTTGAEVDNYGFNILRSTSPNGPFEQVNPTVIPAMGISPGGATYTFVDSNVLYGITYYYRLDDIDNHGMVTAHNIVSAMPMFASKPPASEDKSTTSSKLPPAKSSSASTLTSSPEQTRAFLFQIVTTSGSQLTLSRLEPGAETVAEKKGFGFTAKGKEGQVVLEWVARSRDDGYYLWRSEEEANETYTQITDFLLPAFDMERSDQPLRFEYTDASVSPGVTYHYKLEAMDVLGKSQFIAKVSATPLQASKSDISKADKQSEATKPVPAEVQVPAGSRNDEPRPSEAVKDGER